MTIVDLNPDLEPLYLVCLEDWSPEMAAAGDHKRRWYEKVKDQGLRVKVALDDRGVAGGMIQYLVTERARRAAAGFDDRVAFRIVGTSDRATFLEWGISDALFVDGKEVRIGPPPSAEALRARIARRVQKLPDGPHPDKGRR